MSQAISSGANIVRSNFEHIKDDAQPIDNKSYVRKSAEPTTEALNKKAEAQAVVVNTAVQQHTAPQVREQTATAIKLPTAEADPKKLNMQVAHMSAAVDNVKLNENVRVSTGNEISQIASKGFDICDIANSSSARKDEILQLVTRTFQESRQADEAQKSSLMKLAYTHGENSAKKDIQAGIDGRNMAITQGAVGIAGGLAGGATSLKGNNMNINSTKIHGNNAAKLENSAKSLRTQSMPGSRVDSALGRNDHKINGRAADELSAQAKNQNLQNTIGQLEGNKVSIMGNTMLANSGNMAAIAAANGQVTIAESQAESKMENMNKEVLNAQAQAKAKAQDEANQKVKESIQQLAEQARRTADTNSTIAGNMARC